eukprot:9485907-Pyramimonas_sp.AAC.1
MRGDSPTHYILELSGKRFCDESAQRIRGSYPPYPVVRFAESRKRSNPEGIHNSSWNTSLGNLFCDLTYSLETAAH